MTEWHQRLGAFVTELKRRGVLRVAAVYLIGAWLVIQVADIVFPRLGMPSWTVTFVIVLGALLFPVVVGITWAFDFTARGFQRTPAAAEATPRPGGGAGADAAPILVPQRARRLSVGLAALMAIPLLGFGVWYVNDARGYSLDSRLVAITPFRVAGAASEAHYLREGLMDLIAARIAGAGATLNVVSPRTMSRTLRDELGSVDADPEHLEALRLARELGAGRLLEGEVVGTADRVTVTASLFDTFTGDRIGAPATIATHPDSLHGLVDQIAARLIAAGSGVSDDQLAHLTTTSLPALKLYLEGEAAFRRGQHEVALRAFDHAVTLDTTFALAALSLLRAQGWAPAAPSENSWGRAQEIVGRGLDRLSERDRLYFVAYNGDPDASLRELVDTRLRAAERAPDAADLRYLAGDGLLHFGEALDIDEAHERARILFEETVAMDSAYLEPLVHLHSLAIEHHDTAATRRWGDLLLAIDGSSATAVRVRYAQSLGYAGPDRMGERIDLDTLSSFGLARITVIATGIPTDERVLDVLTRRFDSRIGPDEATVIGRVLVGAGLRTGRPSLRTMGATRAAGDGEWSDVDDLMLALYWLRDADSVRAAMDDVRARLLLVSDDVITGAIRHCVLGHGAVALGDFDEARDHASRIDSLTVPAWVHSCALFLRAAAAVYTGAPDALGRLETYDDTLAAGLSVGQIDALATARLWQHVGRPERALAAVRRRVYLPEEAVWHVELWGEEARLLDQLGRRDEAIEMYQRYLSYREHAEPPFRERADQAEARLAALLGER